LGEKFGERCGGITGDLGGHFFTGGYPIKLKTKRETPFRKLSSNEYGEAEIG